MLFKFAAKAISTESVLSCCNEFCHNASGVMTEGVSCRKGQVHGRLFMHLRSRHCQAASICKVVLIMSAGMMLQLRVSHCHNLLAQLLAQTFHIAPTGFPEAAIHKERKVWDKCTFSVETPKTLPWCFCFLHSTQARLLKLWVQLNACQILLTMSVATADRG